MEYTTRVGQRFVIIPGWYYQSYADELSLAPGDLPLIISAGDSFGSGTHATTRMCLALLETRIRPGDSVFDLGCGSGILSVAAAKLGADRILAADIDPEAERATQENAALNGVSGKIEFRLGSLDVVLNPRSRIKNQKSKVVVANLFAYLLIPFLTDGLGRTLAPGGHLILSGILGRQAERVLVAVRAAGLTPVEQQVSDDDWVALVAQPG